MNIDFGFIITRHVHSEKTNMYWNKNIKLLSIFYPHTKIIIIDDNSNYEYVKSMVDTKNVTVIQSEFPKRGELLPYYYLLKYKFFLNAVIIHDSVFFHKRIHFEKCVNVINILPLWHFNSDDENSANTIKMIQCLHNKNMIKDYLTKISTIHLLPQYQWVGCYGGQCFINLHFLERLEYKYKLTNLIRVVLCRADRCCLERILGVLFCIECPSLLKQKSLMGNIMIYMNWGYTYDQYVNDVNNKNISKPVIKVWSGR